ncbi:MAG: heat-inducible transcriptional repressor HrcA [Clostridia bacterium]|nr:heat-inducible transcriptional repressor HrcA [Clostridia bacterium]
MDLSERKLKILQAIIQDFVQSAEPVGSRTLSKKYDLGISPATIRNEMADLEDMGYIKQPHTSAGRVPSDKAYRLYVDSIMDKYILTGQQKKLIREKILDDLIELDKTIQKASNILSELTQLTSFALTPKNDENKLKYIKLVPVDNENVLLMIVTETGKINNTVLKIGSGYTEENLFMLSKVLTYNYKGRTLSSITKMEIIKDFEEDIETMHKIMKNVMPNFLSTLESMLDVQLYMDGLTNIFSLPEYCNIQRAKDFMEMLSQKDHLTEVLVNRDSGVVITIGQENQDNEMKDCSLITATYTINGEVVGKLGVIGPTRMKYDEVTSIMEYMTHNISKVYKINDDKK